MFKGKKIAIVGHQATQLSLDVLINKMSWQDAIEADWRKSQAWQPGWSYVL